MKQNIKLVWPYCSLGKSSSPTLRGDCNSVLVNNIIIIVTNASFSQSCTFNIKKTVAWTITPRNSEIYIASLVPRPNPRRD